MDADLKRRLERIAGRQRTPFQGRLEAGEIWSLQAQDETFVPPLLLVDMGVGGFVRGWPVDERLEIASSEDPVVSSNRSPLGYGLRIHGKGDLAVHRQVLGRSLGALPASLFLEVCAALAGDKVALPSGVARLPAPRLVERNEFHNALDGYVQASQGQLATSHWLDGLKRNAARVLGPVIDAFREGRALAPADGLMLEAAPMRSGGGRTHDAWDLEVGPWSCRAQLRPYRLEEPLVTLDLRAPLGEGIDGGWLAPVPGGPATGLRSEGELLTLEAPVPPGAYTLSLCDEARIETARLDLEIEDDHR